MSGDWADKRAQEWWGLFDDPAISSLAALLREVKEQVSREAAPFTICRKCHDRDQLLAEVRRVVEEETVRLLHGIADRDQQYTASKLMQEILRRLKAL